MQSSDILVIGGGIAGVSAASFLSNDAAVTVVEAETAIGYHATGRSAAIFAPNYGKPTIRALSAASLPFLSEPAGVSDSSLLSPRGLLTLASENERAGLEDHAAGADGVELIAVSAAAQMVPVLNESAIAAAAYEAAPSDIDVDRFLQGLARQLRANGGTIVTDAAATGIRRDGKTWRVTTRGGEYCAPVVINAAGAWADQVAIMAGVRTTGLQALRRSAALIPAPSGHQVGGWPMMLGASENWYAKPEAGKLMVSPADEDPVEPHDAWADDMVLAEGIHRFENMVTFPVTRVETSWAGLRSFVGDRTPVCGFATDAEGFFWLAGQGGYGVQTAPALAHLCADFCLGRAPGLPEPIVDALSPARL